MIMVFEVEMGFSIQVYFTWASSLSASVISSRHTFVVVYLTPPPQEQVTPHQIWTQDGPGFAYTPLSSFFVSLQPRPPKVEGCHSLNLGSKSQPPLVEFHQNSEQHVFCMLKLPVFHRTEGVPCHLPSPCFECCLCMCYLPIQISFFSRVHSVSPNVLATLHIVPTHRKLTWRILNVAPYLML